MFGYHVQYLSLYNTKFSSVLSTKFNTKYHAAKIFSLNSSFAM